MVVFRLNFGSVGLCFGHEGGLVVAGVVADIEACVGYLVRHAATLTGLAISYCTMCRLLNQKYC